MSHYLTHLDIVKIEDIAYHFSLALLNNATVSGVSTSGTFRIVVADDRVANLTLKDLTIVARSEKYASAVVVSNSACAVALSGGSFQNRILAEGYVHLLRNEGFHVYLNRLVPPNDGGISLGQAFIAAQMLRK